MLSGSSQPLGRRSTPALGAEQVLQTLAGFEEYAAAGTLLVLELVGNVRTRPHAGGRPRDARTARKQPGTRGDVTGPSQISRAAAKPRPSARTQTSPTNDPGSCSQRDPNSTPGQHRLSLLGRIHAITTALC